MTANARHRVVFSPSGKRGEFAPGTDLLSAARALGVDLDSVCGGRGICGRCQIEIGEGAQAKLGFTSSAAHVAAKGDAEARYEAKRGALKAGRRLGCQARLCGDVAVDVPAESQVHRQVVRKAASERPVAVDRVITLHAVQVRPADMHEPSSDGLRLLEVLREQWGLAQVTLPLPVLATLQATLREGGHLVTAAVRRNADDSLTVVALYPGVETRSYGVAVDLGSTTIAAHLCDLATGEVKASAGVMNPQIRFGEDLMSRVSYVMLNTGGERELTAAARGALNDLISALCEEANVARGLITDMTVVGNPVMHHLFVGLNPTELGQAPFALAWDGPLDVAADLGLDIAPGAFVHALPCIAGHVGADAAAVVLAEAPHLADDLTLIVDVGTNAEIVLGHKGRLMACSSPTGPAFEGAQLTAGQRAAPGAIERIRIDPVTLEPRFKVIGVDQWSDEDGFDEGAAATGVTGVCGSGIIEAVAEMYLAGVINEDGVVDGALAARSPRIVQAGRTYGYVIREANPLLVVTQNDVRAIQLAKSALYAGVKLLMEKRAVTAVDQIRFAGGFGSYIDPKYAMVLGLIPDCALENVKAVGNAAGTGARMALLNKGYRREIEQTVRVVEKIETALEPKFQEHFVHAMALPNKVDPFPHLSVAVRLPERKVLELAADGSSGRRGGRRGR